MSKPTPCCIAHVQANDPPEGLTLAEWVLWRFEEDERMARSIAEQLKAVYELIDGETMN